jgi:arsenical resistance protein ArsH
MAPAVARRPGSRKRVVNVMEELFKITLLMRRRTDNLTNGYSERSEKAPKAINRQIEKL